MTLCVQSVCEIFHASACVGYIIDHFQKLCRWVSKAFRKKMTHIHLQQYRTWLVQSDHKNWYDLTNSWFCHNGDMRTHAYPYLRYSDCVHVAPGMIYFP